MLEIYFMKNLCISQNNKKVVVREALFYVSGKNINIWINRI